MINTTNGLITHNALNLTRGAALALLLAASPAWAQPAGEDSESKRIEDNSFLIEEAYNQEPGVIQHIQTFQFWRDKTWNYSFTEELPLAGRKHQFSVSVPFQHLEGTASYTGIGDMSAGYRYQAVDREDLAVAPRFSLIIPTGSVNQETSNGVIGYQVNLPVSVALSQNWVNHWNLGATFSPNAQAAGGARADTLSFNYGTSLVWLASDTLNVLVEFAGTVDESVDPAGGVTRENTFFISPGVRFAINFDSGLQIVPGIAVPIGVGPSSPQYGVFGYLSFEHKAW